MSIPPATKPPIGDLMMAIWKELYRIANILEAGIPPIVPPTTIQRTGAKAPVVEIDSNKASDDVRGSLDNMFYKGSQLFYRPGRCDQGCPKGRSCVEYAPGEECVGWRTRNFKGGK